MLNYTISYSVVSNILHTLPISSIPPIASWHPSKPNENQPKRGSGADEVGGWNGGWLYVDIFFDAFVSCAMIKQTHWYPLVIKVVRRRMLSVSSLLMT